MMKEASGFRKEPLRAASRSTSEVRVRGGQRSAIGGLCPVEGKKGVFCTASTVADGSSASGYI